MDTQKVDEINAFKMREACDRRMGQYESNFQGGEENI
jgi:hypothetical protein